MASKRQLHSNTPAGGANPETHTWFFLYFLTQSSFTTAHRHIRLQLAPVKQKVLAVSVEHSAGGASQLSALHPVEFGENVKPRRH